MAAARRAVGDKAMSRKRWLLLYAAAILAAVIAGFNDHGLIPGLPSSIIGSILNQLVKTVGLLGVGDMVLYFRAKEDLDREREDHQRTRAEFERTRTEFERMRTEFEESRQADAQERAEERAEERALRAEERAFFMEQLRLLSDENRELRAQRNGNGSAAGNPEIAPL